MGLQFNWKIYMFKVIFLRLNKKYENLGNAKSHNDTLDWKIWNVILLSKIDCYMYTPEKEDMFETFYSNSSSILQFEYIKQVKEKLIDR